MDLKAELLSVKDRAQKLLSEAGDLEQTEALRIKFLGKKANSLRL